MKKDYTRFTIRFNPVDPRHQKTMEALEVAGRRKASLIADAVCEYLARHGESGIENTVTYASSLPSNLDNRVIKEEKTPPPVLDSQNISKADIEEGGAEDSENASFDDEMCKAVLNGLNMFNV